MSIFIPQKDWFKAPEGGERTWLGMAIVWCIIMFIMMPYWHFKGKQNSTGEAYKVKFDDFRKKVDAMVAAYPVMKDLPDGKKEPIMEGGMPHVNPPPGDIYLAAEEYRWYPILKLKEGNTYRVHISAKYYNHGFSLVPVNMNFQIVPEYDHVLTLTPTQKGEFNIICNEFCGAGHHMMTGKIIVE